MTPGLIRCGEFGCDRRLRYSAAPRYPLPGAQMSWRANYSAVPVLMFHSIDRTNPNWVWADMSESVEVFEDTIRRIADYGYHAVGLSELYDHMTGVNPLSGRPVVLTFDDGYLDNWVNAVPILRRYGMRGTVYVSPDFVPAGEEIRPTLDDVWQGRIDGESLASRGFMNWAELKAADEEGVLDVQSHAMTHTWHFSGPKVVDFHRPAPVFAYPWLAWNAVPEEKPAYLDNDQQSLVPWGLPVFEHEKSLITRQFRPDPDLVAGICQFVSDNGDDAFFEDGEWMNRLCSRFPALKGDSEFPGSYESEHEYRDRVSQELVRSREIIGNKLSKPVDYIAFPGGGVSATVVELARDAGYRSWTLSSWQERAKKNRPGTNPESIKRISGRSKIHWRGSWVADGGAWWIVARLRTHQGSALARWLARGRKFCAAVGIGQGVRKITAGTSE